MSANPWLIGLAPMLLAAWLLFVIYQGYFLLRGRQWRQRQQEEKEALVKLAIPPDTRKPETFEGVQVIDNGQKHVLPKAPDYQGRFRAVGITVALAPPLALLCLSLQTLLLPQGGPLGAGLVLAEALFLLWLIWQVWKSPNPTQQWLEARIRAELIRREQYLCLAAVGPYLHPGSSPADLATRRLEEFINCDKCNLVQLIPLATPCDSRHGDRLWLDELWQAAGTSPPLPAALERMNSYLYYRIGKQKMWFTLGVDLNRHFERWFTGILKAAVLIAFAAAAIHAALLFEQVQHTRALPLLIHLLAFVLPPLGTAFLALQNLFASRPLTFLYHNTQRELLRLELNLRRLISRYQPSTDESERRRDEIEFRALVLHTEQALTQEMESWILLNHRPEHELAV